MKLAMPMLAAVALMTASPAYTSGATAAACGEETAAPLSQCAGAEDGLTQTVADSVNFPINASVLTRDSELRLDRLAVTIDSLSRLDTLTSIRIKGFSSPDGPEALNDRLARQRAKTAFNYLYGHASSPLEGYSLLSGGEDWNMLREKVEADSGVPGRAEILRIIDSAMSPEEKEMRLRALGSRTWGYLARNVFPSLRRARITVSWTSLPQIDDTVEFVSCDTVVAPAVTPPLPVASGSVAGRSGENLLPAIPTAETWRRHYYIKTNLLGWPCLWANAEGEADIAPHWSAALSVYYSGWNYFRRTSKFRTFTVMPEFRFWTRGRNDGFFMGAHFGMCYYNVALGGDSRYQDHDGTTPALGGGLTLGYRLPLRNPRWKLEFSAGAGIYHLDYDIFENRPDGLLTGRRQRTFYGLDKVAVSLCYTFGKVSSPGKGGAE